MEFKITKDKIVQWNKMLLGLNKINKIYSPCLVSVVHLAYFIIFEGFWGVCCNFLYKRPVLQGRSPAEIRIRRSTLPPNAKKDYSPLSIYGRPANIFLDTAPVQTTIASLLEPSTLRHTLWPSFRLQYGLKSTLATDSAWQLQLTRQVHSQNFH